MSDHPRGSRRTGDFDVSRPWSATSKIVVVVFGVVVLVAIVLRFRGIISPLIVAGLIAYLLVPIVNFVHARMHIPRGVVTAAIYLLTFGLVALMIGLLAPLLVHEAFSVQLDFRQIGSGIETFISQPLQIGGLHLDLRSVYENLMTTLTDLVQPLATQAMTFLAGAVNVVIDVIFIGIVSFYLTKDGPAMKQWLTQWVPRHLRYDLGRLWKELAALWRAFLRGQLLLALTMGLTVGVAMAVVGMKNALILGILAFFLEFLPSVGHGIWLAVAVPLALFQGSLWIRISNVWFALLVLGVHLVLEQVDINFFIPRIVGRQVRLHPMVVIIGIIVGGMLGGVLGILLAAPTIASLGILARYAYCKLLDLPPWPDLEVKSSAETCSRAVEPGAQEDKEKRAEKAGMST